MPIDAPSLARLIETQAAALQLWVRSICSSSEDVVQDAFSRLAVEASVPDNPVAWLYRVSRNLALKQRQSESRRRSREAAVARPELDPKVADPLELADIRQAVEQLEPTLREVLVARLWGQLSLEEVGELCGFSTATAHRRYESALESLRSLLQPQPEHRT